MTINKVGLVVKTTSLGVGAGVEKKKKETNNKKQCQIADCGAP